MSMPLRVAVIHDTSYLLHAAERQMGVQDVFPLSHLEVIDYEHIITTEVMREIEGLLRGDRRTLAAAARGLIVAAHGLFAESDCFADGRYSLPDVPLGADSAVDRKQIEYAVHLASSGHYAGVIIMTRDGGIARTVQKLARDDILTAGELSTSITRSVPGAAAAIDAHQRRERDRMDAEQKARQESEAAECQARDKEYHDNSLGLSTLAGVVVLVLGLTNCRDTHTRTIEVDWGFDKTETYTTIPYVSIIIFAAVVFGIVYIWRHSAK